MFILNSDECELAAGGSDLGYLAFNLLNDLTGSSGAADASLQYGYWLINSVVPTQGTPIEVAYNVADTALQWVNNTASYYAGRLFMNNYNFY